MGDDDEQIVNIQKKTALLEYLHLIETFSGEGSSVTFRQFLTSFERISNLFAWKEDEKLFALQSRLTGSAANLLDKYVKDKKSFDEIIKILQDRYEVKDSPAIALQKFLNFRQTPGMKVRDFYDKANELSATALSVEGCADAVVQSSQKAMLKSMLLSNLAPEIRKGVVAKDPGSPEEILKYALLEERAWDSVKTIPISQTTLPPPTALHTEQHGVNLACAASNSREQGCKQSQEIEKLKQMVEVLSTQVASLVTASNVNSAKTEITCFRCSKVGHYARECNNYGQNFNSRGSGNSMREFDRHDRGFHNYRGYNRGNYSNQFSNNYRGSYNNNNRGYRNNRGRYGNNRGRYEGEERTEQMQPNNAVTESQQNVSGDNNKSGKN